MAAAPLNPSTIPVSDTTFGLALVRVLLLAAFLFATITAFKLPGTGIAELAALVLLSAILAPAIIKGDVHWYELALIAGGLALLCIEIFLIPGFGATGVAGMLLLAAGFLLVFLPATGANHSVLIVDFRNALVMLVGGSVLGIASFVWMSSHFPALTRTSKLVLRETNAAKMPEHLWPRVGDIGIAMTDLKPGGIAQLPDPTQTPKRVDVVCKRGFVSSGKRIIVIDVVGQVITVKPEESS